MKLHIENSIVIEMNGKTATLGCGEYEFDSPSEFIKFIEGLGEPLKQPLIKDEKIRKAVRYWLKCNSGFSAKVICKNNSTTFISEFGEILTFDYALDFNDARMYGEWCNRSFSIQSLCGKEEE